MNASQIEVHCASCIHCFLSCDRLKEIATGPSLALNSCQVLIFVGVRVLGSLNFPYQRYTLRLCLLA